MWRKLVIILAAAFHAAALDAHNDDGVRLIVNIVVGQMRSDAVERYAANFSDSGIGRFLKEGMVLENGYYDFMQTITPATLATLTTGVNPSMHGAVSDCWVDYVTGQRVRLTDDQTVRGLDSSDGAGRCSPCNLTLPTVGDNLLSANPDSKVISVAADALSSVVLSGRKGKAFWFDENNGNFVSSTAYMDRLPTWLIRYNGLKFPLSYVGSPWTLCKQRDKYLNRRYSVFEFKRADNLTKVMMPAEPKSGNRIDYRSLLYSPYGNTIVAEFAAQVVSNESLGSDAAVDILNVCFDASRYVCRRYGPESLEAEDMLYRLDGDIADLIGSITKQVPLDKVLFVLTSDHGSSDSFDCGPVPADRFNADQFKVIMNSFLSVQFGAGEWVLDYIDRQLYLNHNLIYQRNLSLKDVQDRAASFALQFRGVSHVLTSSSMLGGYFGDSYGEKMQNSFYPRRAGDLMLNLMPGWILECEDAKSQSGSMYDYDTRVPLMLLGWKIPSGGSSEEFDMTCVAPTLARIMRINRPIASAGHTISNLDDILESID